MGPELHRKVAGRGPCLVKGPTMPDIAPPTIRSVAVVRTELRCRHEHPDARRIARFKGRLHDSILMVVPFLCVPTRRILDHESEVRIGLIGAYCRECKAYSEYEVVTPVEMAS